MRVLGRKRFKTERLLNMQKLRQRVRQAVTGRQLHTQLQTDNYRQADFETIMVIQTDLQYVNRVKGK